MDSPSSHTTQLRLATASVLQVFHDSLRAEMLEKASQLAGVEVVDGFTMDDGYQVVLQTWHDRILHLDDFFPEAVDEPFAEQRHTLAWFVADSIHTLESISGTLRQLAPAMASAATPEISPGSWGLDIKMSSPSKA